MKKFIVKNIKQQITSLIIGKTHNNTNTLKCLDNKNNTIKNITNINRNRLLLNNNELIILFKNNNTSTFVESKWLIKDITSTKLIYQITYTDNSKYDYYFKISYE